MRRGRRLPWLCEDGKEGVVTRGMRRIVPACMCRKAAVEPEETHTSTPESRNLKQTAPVVVILLPVG